MTDLYVARSPVGRRVTSVAPCVFVVNCVRSSVSQCCNCQSVNTVAESAVGSTGSRRIEDSDSALASVATGVNPDYEGLTSREGE